MYRFKNRMTSINYNIVNRVGKLNRIFTSFINDSRHLVLPGQQITDSWVKRLLINGLQSDLFGNEDSV